MRVCIKESIDKAVSAGKALASTDNGGRLDRDVLASAVAGQSAAIGAAGGLRSAADAVELMSYRNVSSPSRLSEVLAELVSELRAEAARNESEAAASFAIVADNG